MEVIISLVCALLSNGVVLFFIKRYFTLKDRKEAAQSKKRELLFKRVDTSLETLRLLAYARMSQEIERLLNKRYATPSERRVLDEMYINYKEHGWNGDMDVRLKKVYAMRTDRKEL